ncbi:WD repeat-containing protein 18 [Venturia canescens]|uniref:WD repeat-containing protein 18 n=1 Tax=Venturia canescens TaxID=32260 RepID=UPI001C9C8861|nr:WD repeat-containing protein 18 [Venturia canescens]
MKNSREVVVTSDSSGESWSAAVWDPFTGSLLSTYRNAAALGHHTLQIVGDTFVIAADVTKPRLHVWPLNSQSPVPNLRLTTTGKVSALACTPDGSYIAVASGEKIFIWQLTSGRLLGKTARHYQTVTCLKFGKDGANFASGGEDGLVFVWSLTRIANQHEQSAPIHSFSDHSLPVKDLHYGHFTANARLISVSLDRTARIYDTNAGTLLLTLIFDVPLTSVCTDLCENDLYVGSSNGLIMRFNLRDPPRGIEYHVPASSTSEKSDNPAYRGHTGGITALSVSSDCRTLLSGSADCSVNFWDIPSRQVIRTLNHKGSITTAAFVPAYENFRASTLRPKIQIHPLHRIFDESGADSLLEIISSRDDSELLNLDAYLDRNYDAQATGSDACHALAEARNEIETLKAKNSELYKYAVKVLISKEATKKTE